MWVTPGRGLGRLSPVTSPTHDRTSPENHQENFERPKDDEQRSKESIEKTGEPVRNDHGYQDGAS